MIHPAKKFVLAVLLLAVGWGLSWPFRKAAKDPGMPVANLNDQVSWTGPLGVRQTPPHGTKGAPKGSGIRIPTTQATSPPSQGENSLSAAGPTPQTVPPPHGNAQSLPPQVRQAARPISLSQTGSAPRFSTSRPKGPSPRMSPGTPLPDTQRRNPRAHVPTSLPTRMPNHYEPEYAFPKKIGLGPQDSVTQPEETRPCPAYATAKGSLSTTGAATSPWPHEILHEVQNSDTLEKLALRYLDNSSRALEIFDLNRDKLKNPEMLPIGAELRIPANGSRIVD